MKRSYLYFLAFLVFAFCLNTPSIYGLKISSLETSSFTSKVVRFFSLDSVTLRWVLVSVCLLSINCGLVGSFLVVQGRALLGDTIAHAVLPGIAIAFFLTFKKDLVFLSLGAMLAGFIAIFVYNKVREIPFLKEDSAMGLVLSGFYALGICLLTLLQNIPTAHQAGLDKFLFGQAAAISHEDLFLIAVSFLLTVLSLGFFYKAFLIVSFDSVFAKTIGIQTRFVNNILLFLIILTIVISIKAVGIVLVSAMLVIPPVTGLLLSNRLYKVIFLSSVLSLGAGVCGSFFSFVKEGLPTGPFMVLCGAGAFFSVLMFAPRKGIIAKWLRRRKISSLH